MRISTSGMHQNALATMLTQQATLSKTQNQIASGRRVQTPADDPVAAVHIMELERAQQESDQFAANAAMARNRLTLEEQALADVTTLVQRVHELTVQGANASVGATDRRMIATELRGRLQELVDIANRRDAGGEYLFSGYDTLTQPFVKNSAGPVLYQGDAGSRLLQIGPDQRVADSHAGARVFEQVPNGNGVFVTGAAAGNTGSGVLTTGSVVDPSQWIADSYTLTFTSAAGDYEIRDSANAVVSSGRSGWAAYQFTPTTVRFRSTASRSTCRARLR